MSAGLPRLTSVGGKVLEIIFFQGSNGRLFKKDQLDYSRLTQRQQWGSQLAALMESFEDTAALEIWGASYKDSS